MDTTLCLFLFVSLILSGKVLASEETIVTITNDENKETYNFVAQTDDRTNTISAFYKDDYANGIKKSRKVLPSQNLTTNGGMILEKRKDYNIINLKSDNFDLEQGGLVTIDTLYDGMNGERKEYELELAKAQDGKWKLFRGHSIISKLHIIVNKKMIIGSVGVKEIIMK